MKTFKYFKPLLLGLVVILGLVACGKDKYQEPVVSFQISKVELPSAYTAGEGFVEVTEDGFSITSEAPTWLTAELESPKRVKVKLAKNESPESRTASIVLTKGETVQRIAVTQVGVVNQANLTSQEFTRKGGVYEVSLEQMDSTPQIEVSASWITYKIEGGKLIFAVAPLEGDDRTATVRVSAGLFDRTVQFTQTYGAPLYEELLGDYTLDFILEAGKPTQNLDVRLEQNEAGKSYRLSGLLDLVITYNEKTGKMQLAPQALKGGDANDFAYAWLSGYSGKYNLSNAAVLIFEATWNKDEQHPKFVFTCPGKMTVDGVEYPVRGIAFYNTSQGKGWVRRGPVDAITDFSLTKK